MTDFALNNGPFPPGTSVKAYPVSNWPLGVDQGAAPLGAATDTQTAGASGLTFTGLTSGAEYVAHAQVGGVPRYVSFRVGADSDPEATDSEVAAAIAAHAADTSTHGVGEVADTADVPAARWAAWKRPGTKIQTVDDLARAGGAGANSSGRIALVALPEPLRAGESYSSITFCSHDALSGLSNQWFSIVQKSNLTTLRSTVDDTNTAWGATAFKTLNLSTPYVPVADVDVYLGVTIVATGMGTLKGFAAAAEWVSGAMFSPVLFGWSTSGLTTPVADSTVLDAIATGFGFLPYAAIS